MDPVTAPTPAGAAGTERPGWKRLLTEIYGPDRAEAAALEVDALLRAHRAPDHQPRPHLWSEHDVWFITYPDQFQAPGTPPLTTLRVFLESHLRGLANGVHVLPFFPSSSDEGFSIIDYDRVDPAFGSWSDLEAIAADWRLMVDAVINHTSSEAIWFEAWRSGAADFENFYRTAQPDADLSRVVRAREHPLLTPFETASGSRWVWTTFSADQVDLDYRNPGVLVRVLEVLLGYVARGIDVIRLDAIGFLWKDEASPSIHLPETHQVVRFLRACLDDVGSNVILVTETNVPHRENVSYLGGATEPEAHAVYQFPLPPLTLHAFAMADATRLGGWLRDLEDLPVHTTYLNFLASHDGVGLRPLEDLADRDEIDALVAMCEANGGLVSSRTTAGNTRAPYELNATWFDLVRGDTTGDDALARHLGSHAVMLAARGIPALYVQGLFAGQNDLAGVAVSGRARSINRRRCDDISLLDAQLSDPATREARSAAGLREMIGVRTSHRAFHPDSEQRILETPPPVLGIERVAGDGPTARVYVNVTGQPVTVTGENGPVQAGGRWAPGAGGLELGPWGYAWVVG